MQYPDAFCVRCGKKTETKNKHTVVLQNNSRALHGHCASCESEVYRLMPAKEQAKETAAAEPRLRLAVNNNDAQAQVKTRVSNPKLGRRLSAAPNHLQNSFKKEGSSKLQETVRRNPQNQLRSPLLQRPRSPIAKRQPTIYQLSSQIGYAIAISVVASILATFALFVFLR